MEPDKKKSRFLGNLEWIALIVLILGGLVIIWRIFYPDFFE